MEESYGFVITSTGVVLLVKVDASGAVLTK